MKIIVPMAGMGKRMRPHTLTIPKPLVPIAGKPIVEILVHDISAASSEKIDEVAFIIGRTFGEVVENKLKDIAKNIGAKASIYYQDEALGTAHAIQCANDSLKGKVFVAFADTLFKADFKIDESHDGVIFVQQIENPAAFGVVKLDQDNVITDFVEKPEVFVSDLAIIGIYYFKDGENLSKELQYLLDNDIREKGEYQLTNAMENMKNKGLKLVPGKVEEWLDCGNKDATVYTNQRILSFKETASSKGANLQNKNSLIIEPCYIGNNVVISNSIVGPYASIGDNTTVADSIVRNSIVQTNTKIKNSLVADSMVGNSVVLEGKFKDLSLGDYNTIKD